MVKKERNQAEGSRLRKKIGLFWFLGILCCFCLCSPLICLAAGEGDGGGGGAAVPLLMDWCYPADGETGVSVMPVIQCKYSHNVAQGTVQERNLTLLSLAEENGTVVETVAYTADAQIEFDKRQFLYLRPVKPLKYHTTYVVTAKAGIQAKNGMITEVDQQFRFTTAGPQGDFNASTVASMVGPEDGFGSGEQQAGEKLEAEQTMSEDNQETKQQNQQEDAMAAHSAESIGTVAEGEQEKAAAPVAAEMENDSKQPEQISWFWLWLLLGLLVISLLGKMIWLQWQKKWSAVNDEKK